LDAAACAADPVKGMRFVKRGDRWLWVWPELMRPEDIDCTDMPDDELEKLAKINTPK
jgi:hypothetical protein